MRGGWKSQARASGSVLPADPRGPHLLRALPHNAHQGPSPVPDVPVSLLSTAGSPGARAVPLGLAVGAQAPPDASYFCVPSQPGAGEVEVLPGRVQSSVSPDKAVLRLPPHPAPGPLKVMVTMKRRGQGECRSQVQVCGGDGQTAPLGTVWKGL